MLILVRGKKKMRAGALGVGVFLLAIGIVIFWLGYSDLQQYGGLFGQISQSLSSEVRSKVAQDQFMAVGGESWRSSVWP
jgi:hypothetical protein